MRLFVLLSLISFEAFAMNWFDMEAPTEYTVTQGFSLTQLERSGSATEIMKGEKFVLKELVGLGIGLALFNFEYKNCPGPEHETDIEVIPVDGTAPPVEVGIMVAKECELWVYVELKDFWTKSLFE